jgi:flagellar motor switch protein FliM
MADILSQDEVDLLLSAVTENKIEAPAESAVDGIRVSAYDFRRPERVSTEQLKGLQSLFEAFAREASIVLPAFLRTIVRIDLNSIDQLTYDEFILSVSRPTSLNIINMAPLDGNAVIDLHPAIIFPIVDRVLGGKGAPLSEPRELTEIEERIVARLVMMLLDSWKRSWEQLIEFNMTIMNQESDPLIVQIVAGSEMVILVGYEVHIGETVGAMNMCIPLVVINPILDQISSQTHFRRRLTPEAASATREQVARSLHKVKVNLDAALGHVRLPISSLAALEVGDVVQLDTKAEYSFSVEIGGIVHYRAKLGRVGEHSAVQITELVRD